MVVGCILYFDFNLPFVYCVWSKYCITCRYQGFKKMFHQLLYMNQVGNCNNQKPKVWIIRVYLLNHQCYNVFNCFFEVSRKMWFLTLIVCGLQGSKRESRLHCTPWISRDSGWCSHGRNWGEGHHVGRFVWWRVFRRFNS